MTDTYALGQIDELSRQLRDQATAFRLGGYDPYPFQKAFHACIEGRYTTPHAKVPTFGPRANQVMASCANQIGKSTCGGADIAYHVTGQYPPWWEEGWPRLDDMLRKFPEVWVGGENNDRVRDIIQKELFGPPEDPSRFGTGWIAADRIAGTPVKKTNVPNAFESVTIRHGDGEHSFNVIIKFKSYKSDILDWAGTPLPLIWLDEEPPQIYYTQALARTTATGGYVKMTFTPEKGTTQLISQFVSDLKDGQEFIIAGWDDAAHGDGRTHLSETHLAKLIGAFPPHERDMRSKGIPVLGAGMVFPVTQEQIMIDPRPLPRFAFHLIGMDFGSGGVNHPTAAAWWAFDRDAKQAILYRTYKSRATELGVHALALRGKESGKELWIPVAWPHDGNRREAYATEGVANAYRMAGVNMLWNHFADPDTGTTAVEPGILAMYQAMIGGSEDGWTIKVFNTCHEFWAEYPLYHRSEKDSTIVDVNDDVMSAARIGFRSERYAQQEERVRNPVPAGVAQGTDDRNVFLW